MKQDYILYTYKKDLRATAGERLVGSAPCHSTEQGMKVVVTEMSELFPAITGYRFEYHPKTPTNLLKTNEKSSLLVL